MKKNSWKKGKIAAAVVLLSLLSITGNRGLEAEAASSGKQDSLAGTIRISASSEIQVDYDKNGKVLTVVGKNEEGKKILEDCPDYEGRSCERVISELVQEIYDDGYFDHSEKEKTKNIVIRLEPGSQYPEDDFMKEIIQEAREVAVDRGIKSSAIVLDDDYYTEEGYIGKDRAKELALEQFHLSSAEFLKQEHDFDDGVYEIEFIADGVKYEVKINAVTGKVVETEKDLKNDDDDRYDDDRYDDDRYDDDRHDDDRDDDDDRYDDDDRDDDDRYDDDRHDNDRDDDDHDDDRDDDHDRDDDRDDD